MARILTILILFLCVSRANGQLTDTAPGTFTIDSMYVLTVGSGTNFVFGSVDDYATGIEKLNYASVTLKCNYNWIINVKATTALFSGGGGNMPCTILNIKKTGGSYFTISDAIQPLATGTRGSTSNSGNTFNIDLKATPGYLYNGGNYTITLLYSVTKQ